MTWEHRRSPGDAESFSRASSQSLRYRRRIRSAAAGVANEYAISISQSLSTGNKNARATSALDVPESTFFPSANWSLVKVAGGRLTLKSPSHLAYPESSHPLVCGRVRTHAIGESPTARL
jgi:hypothetical protein